MDIEYDDGRFGEEDVSHLEGWLKKKKRMLAVSISLRRLMQSCVGKKSGESVEQHKERVGSISNRKRYW